MCPFQRKFYIVKVVYAGVKPNFLIFGPKHRLWVRVPTNYVLSKDKTNIFFSAENFQFLKLRNISLLHGQVFVMIQKSFIVN